MNAGYKSIRTIVSAALALALTGVLLFGVLDAGAAAGRDQPVAPAGR